MLDYIACLIVRALNMLFSFVPVSVTLWLGRRIGAFVFIVNKKRRLIAYANLRSAFAKEKSPRELKAITRRVYQNMAQTFAEALNLTKVNKKYYDRFVEIVNIQRIHNAAKSGRGTVLLTAHFGDWELSNLISSVIGYPILVLAREQKMKRLNELLNKLRESNGCKVIRKGMSTKNILKALYGKNIVGILSDQDAGRKGVFVDFFGRPTSCHSGPFEIAKHTGSLILPNFIVRTRGPYHKLYLEEYIDFASAKSNDDIKQNLQKFARLLESYVRKYPDQWLWLHKRWKSTPTRTVLVLNDGKAGHLNQSLAVAAEIRKARAGQGYSLEDTRIAIVDVKFRNAFLRTVLSVCAAFSSWRCHGCMRCMKFCLEEKSYRTLVETYSDFVVSCGSGAAAANIFAARENNAKNIIVMRPDIFMGLGKFNLAVIPKHDRVPKRENVVTTNMAPNLIEGGSMKADGERLRERIGKIGEKTLGLLVGGDNPEFSLTEDAMRALADGLARFCERHDAEIIATTSRRTSRKAEDALKSKFAGNKRCRLLVIANEKNIDAVVPGILALCKAAVVSEESISMVSEAVSSGKKVVVFRLKKKKPAPAKHERALKDLEREGYITMANPEDLYQVLEKVWKDDSPVKRLRDSEKIFEAVRRLI